jgi:hypothetical protein
VTPLVTRSSALSHGFAGNRGRFEGGCIALGLAEGARRVDAGWRVARLSDVGKVLLSVLMLLAGLVRAGR